METVPKSPEAPQQSSDLMTEWEIWMDVSRGLSPNTQKLYARTVQIAQQDLGDLTDLTAETLEAWLQSKGGRAGTYANRICALTSFYRFLVKTKRRADNPASELDRPRLHRGVPKPVKDLPSVLEALDASDRTANYWGNAPRRVGETRDMAVFLSETGLRIHEAVALNVEVPCPETIHVLGKGHKEAVVLLTDEARAALDRLGGCWPIGARATQRRFEKAGTHPHAFRHHLGCSLAASGADLGEIQDLLRHSSPATSRIYAAYSTERLKAAQARRREVRF